MAALLDRHPFTYKEGKVLVDCSDSPRAGQTRWAGPDDKGAPVEVAVGVDENAFLKFFWETMRSTPVLHFPKNPRPKPPA